MFAFFILLVALTISGVSAYYSIIGLTTIFSAAKLPIIIMGASLEIGKVVSTVWLHKYWDKVSIQFKLYLVPAILILMLITSMGVYGFLAKAHMDQAVPAGDVIAQVQIFDDKIQTEKDNIESAKRALQQMDAQVDQMLGRTSDDTGAARAVKIRKQQAEERKSIQESIIQSQKTIVELQSQKAPIAAEVRKVEAEVGPLKYIAALIYGDELDSNSLERAVRWVILLLIFVFDPLAVILILVADQSFEWNKQESNKLLDIEEPALIVEEIKLENNIEASIEKIEPIITEHELNNVDIESSDKYKDLLAKPDLDVMNDYIQDDLLLNLRTGNIKFQQLSRIEQQLVLDKMSYQEKSKYLK